MRPLSRLENGLLIGGFLLECVRTWWEARKDHDLEERVDALEEKVQTLQKKARKRRHQQGEQP